MPELPEVETVLRQMKECLGKKIIKAETSKHTRFIDGEKALHKKITAIRRLGKYLLFELDQTYEMVIHLGMTGVLALGNQNEKHLQASWQLEDSTMITYTDARKFGRIKIVVKNDYKDLGLLANLGQEPLDKNFSTAKAVSELVNSKSGIKAVLLSQHVIAGVGNIYADEALWDAKIHPLQKNLTRREADTLVKSTINALKKGVLNGGTTLKDYRNAHGEKGSNQTSLMCYSRAGEACFICSNTLVKENIAGRGSTYCPNCQKLTLRNKATTKSIKK